MSRQMSEVSLFYDGTYEINNIGESDYATQHLYGSKKVNGKWKDCEIYHCIKGKEKYYLRKLAKSIIAEKEKQISKLTEEKYKLIDVFEDLLKE